jgi:hypothetical protein
MPKCTDPTEERRRALIAYIICYFESDVATTSYNGIAAVNIDGNTL